MRGGEGGGMPARVMAACCGTPVPCVEENRGLIDHLLHRSISQQPFNAHRDIGKKRKTEKTDVEMKRRRKTQKQGDEKENEI